MNSVELHLIPWPSDVRLTGGTHRSDAEMTPVCHFTDSSLPEEARRQIPGQAAQSLPLNRDESYRLRVLEDQIIMEGSPCGVFYAKQTLKQLQSQFGNAIPCMEITDQPRFSYRGFMLDSSRHFLPKEFIKTLLDAAALLKLNKFHWHLTDDQAWRIEIRSYPMLTQKGALRGKAHFADLPEPEETHDYFSQEDIREVVAYAAERFIDVIPELELPGHASALLFACPELACEGAEASQVQITGGIFPQILCAGNEETSVFIKHVLDEYMSLFPYPYIHLGGDEAIKAHWRSCPKCQRKIRELGLKDENALQQWLLRQAASYLAAHGRHAVAWNEVLRGEPLPTDVLVQMWHGDEDLIKQFTSRGGKIIQSSTAAYYLDYPYYQTDLSRTLSFDPVPDFLKENESAVIGIEAPLWTERVTNRDRAAFQLFPRLPAAAERAWTTAQAPAPSDRFQDRYRNLDTLLKQLGLSGAPEEYWDETPALAAEEKAAQARIMNTPFLHSFRRRQDALLDEERKVYGRF